MADPLLLLNLKWVRIALESFTTLGLLFFTMTAVAMLRAKSETMYFISRTPFVQLNSTFNRVT